MYLRHGIGDLRAVTLEGESTYNEQTGYEEYELDEDAVLEEESERLAAMLTA